MPDRATGFVQRTRLIVAPGAVQTVAVQADSLGMSAPVALVDPALAQSERIAAALDLVGPERVIIRAPGEPSFASVQAAAARMSELEADGVIAIGGGSTLDTGKLARGIMASGASLAELPAALKEVIPLIACPTTAGTGAEVGAGAIVFSPLLDDKVLIRRHELAADVVLADGDLTLDLPPDLTAYTGLDAFAQALMAYAPAGPDAISGQVALQAMRTVWRWLPVAVSNPDDADARAKMMLGSVMSALGMFNAPAVYAGEHVFAEPVGAALKCHHGHAVAAFLPATAEFNLEPFAARYAEVAAELGLAADDERTSRAARAFVEALQGFVISLGVPPLADVVESYDLEQLVERCAANEAYELNPRPIGAESARAILRSGFDGSFALSGEPSR